MGNLHQWRAADSSDAWRVTGENTTENVSLFCQLDGNLNVVDLVETDPGYTSFTGPIPTVKFPAVFPNGLTPDQQFPQGVYLQTFITASNAVDTATGTSNLLGVGAVSGVTLLDSNPADCETYDVIKSNIEGYIPSREAFKTNMRSALVGYGITSSQLAAIGL
jgi:hypothetical protein